MEKLRKYLTKLNPIIILVFLYLIFTTFKHMDVAVPLAGDDWGYAYKGMHGNPIVLAWEMYFSWSGRFFAELWGFFMAPRKELWETINPLMFTCISACLLYLYAGKEKMITCCVVAFTLILNVSTTLRLETYAWIMGSTYVTALLALLIHLICLKKIVLDKSKYKLLFTVLSCICSFFICLDMENAAAITVLINIVSVGYVYLTTKTIDKHLVVVSVISIIAIALLRLSPGATYRLTADNAAFNSLSLFEKIGTNWPNFLYYTFLDSEYVMPILSGVLLIYCGLESIHSKNKKYILFTIFYLIACFVSITETLYNYTSINVLKIFFDVYYSRSAILVMSVFYVIYTVITIIVFLDFDDQNKSIVAISTLVLAGCANGVMLLSPIFGARSSLYTVYLLIGLILLILSQIKCIYVDVLLVLGLGAFTYQKYNYLMMIYDHVEARKKLRDTQIAYYQDHEDEDIHITRYLPQTVHSADIEIGDDYHFETFKEYYGFDPDRVVIFEWAPGEGQ